MGINDEVRRRLEEMERREYPGLWARRTSEPLALDPEVLALGRKFVGWARQSGIKQEPFAWEYRSENRLFRKSRQVHVPMEYGWCLKYLSANHNCDSGFCQHNTSIKLMVLDSGYMKWTESDYIAGPELTSWYVEQQITDFIVESRSTVPWPD